MATQSLVAPVSGTVIDLADVPDPTFAKGALGQGFGIADPTDTTVVSPVTGTVTMVARTSHAIGLHTEDGLDVLVHLGIDTVELQGRPFALSVVKGDQVQAGDAIATWDTELVAQEGKSTCTIVAVTNSATTCERIDAHVGTVRAGDPAATIVRSGEDEPEQQQPQDEQPAAAVAPLSQDQLAAAIIDGVGGAENIRNHTHCITRLRFNLKDESQARTEYLQGLDGVIEIIRAGGQYQVVIGPGVEDLYDTLAAQLGGADDAPALAGDVDKPTTTWGWVKHGFASLIGVITGSMIPVIGLLAASGIIKGILSLLLNFDVITKTSSTFILIDAMSDAVFYFLPIFVGFTAARRLGADPIIVAIIGGVITYPAIIKLAEGDASSSLLGMPLNADFFGLPFHVAQYSYSIFPIIVAAWLASILEPQLKRFIPTTVRMIFLPLVEVVVVSLAILLLLGPVVMFISTGIANGIQALYDLSPTISGLFIGGFYQSLVIFGLHWAVIPLVAQDIALNGNSPLNAIISATMVAQGGAVLAVFFKSRLLKVKELSGSAAIAAFCGITEPAMYGVNLKYGRTFIMASIGGACGGLLTGLFKVNMWGFTGSLIGFTSFVNPEGLDFSFWGFWIASAVAAGVAFVLTWLFGFKDSDVETGREVKKVRLGRRDPVQK